MIAIYARQSIDKKDSISIETQVDYCRVEAAGEETAVYCDRGYSGSTTHRPAFERLLADVRGGRVHKVIIYKLDRISRSLLDFAHIVELFRRCGVAFQSTQEKFDTDTPMGNAMLSITMVFAQLERETLQQRLRDNYYARGQKGMYLGGKPPFGFTRVPALVEGKRTTMLQSLPEKGRQVTAAFERYAAGDRTLSDLARELSAGQPAGGECTAGFLARMLRNPVYARADACLYDHYAQKGLVITNPVEDFIGCNGCYLYGQRRRDGGAGGTLSVALHEGLVDSDVFLAVQRRLEQNSTPSRSGTGEGSWLSGLICCGTCGAPLTLKTNAYKAKRYRYLCCSCGNHLAERLEQAVETALLAAAESLQKQSYAVDRNTVDLTRLKVERSEAQHKIDRLIAAAADGDPQAMTHLGPAITRLDSDLHRIEAQLATLPGREPPVYPMAQLLAQWQGFDTGGKRCAAQLLLRQVDVAGEELHLHWRCVF